MKLVVSDMTCIRHKGKLHEWVYMLDTFNNEIIASHLARRQAIQDHITNVWKISTKKE